MGAAYLAEPDFLTELRPGAQAYNLDKHSFKASRKLGFGADLRD